MFKKLMATALIICMLFASVAEAGKGGGGVSGGRSSSTSRSSGSGMSGSRSTSSSRPSMPSSSRTSTSRSAPSGMKPSAPSKPITAPTTSRSKPSGMTTQHATPNKPVTTQSKPTATKSNVDNKVNKMVKVGNTSLTKTEAINKFKTENAAKYQSTYKTEPATRPAHIPKTYSSGGNNYNITYNHGYGGYGYYGPSGAWIMYDAMRDAAMMSVLMNHHGYRDVVVTQPTVVNQDGVVVSQPAPVVVYRNGYISFFVGFLFVLALVFFLIFAMKVS